MLLTEIFNKYGFTEEEKRFMHESGTAETANMNQSRIVSEMILGKNIENAARNFVNCANSLNIQLGNLSMDLKVNFSKNTEKLAGLIEKYSISADKHSKSIRRLTLWLIIVGFLAAFMPLVKLLIERFIKN